MKYFIANWKMYLGRAEALALAEDLRAAAQQVTTDARLIACPSFVHLEAVGRAVRGSSVELGAQDAHYEHPGAFTSAVSVEQLKELSVSYALAGHSERRRYFGETDDMVNKKVKALSVAGIQPVICVGETDAERDAGKTKERVAAQVRAALQDICAQRVIIAYEPVWAIGAGKTPSVEDACAVQQIIKQTVAEARSAECAVLYGGSVTPDNIKLFWNAPDIDGVLVGGASARQETLSSLLALIS